MPQLGHYTGRIYPDDCDTVPECAVHLQEEHILNKDYVDYLCARYKEECYTCMSCPAAEADKMLAEKGYV